MKHVEEIFQLQGPQALKGRSSTAHFRIAQLQKLKSCLLQHEAQILEALNADLRKCSFEASLTEFLFCIQEIDFAIKHLKDWMRLKKVGSNLQNLLARSAIQYQSKGRVLILAPWNYPFQLSISPLISALAAGNTVMLKPSELSPNTSSTLNKILSACFPAQKVYVAEGDAGMAQALLELPFDHLFFTGSGSIGKIVMQAAAKNLSSVTLELGGKSPCIISQHCDIEQAATKVAWGKLINAGQTCIAPDYVFVQENIKEVFLKAYIKAVRQMFYHEDQLQLNHYARIVNEKHFLRLQKLLEAACHAGARNLMPDLQIAESLSFGPALLDGLSTDNPIMQDEIFGPILPVLTYKTLPEVLDYLSKRAKPLALYLFSERKAEQQMLQLESRSGGLCINDVLVHISNPHLPFGGVNQSGIGSSHGFHGFKAFSHERAVFTQSKWNFNKFIYPPYKHESTLLKWLKRLT